MSPTDDEAFTIAPPPDASIRGISYFMHRKTPVRFTARTRLQFSSETSARSEPVLPMTPALLKAQSSRPYASTARLQVDGLAPAALVDVGYYHARALAGERKRSCPPDPRAGAGDDGSLPLEPTRPARVHAARPTTGRGSAASARLRSAAADRAKRGNARAPTDRSRAASLPGSIRAIL